MNLLLKLGWRNVWRNRRRSILTILAITFATFFTVVMRGLGIGVWEYNVQNTVELFSGYLQIQRTGYQNNPSLNKNFPFPGDVEAAVRTDRDIKGYAPRILADGLISYRANSSGAAIFGIDPDAERRIFRFQQRLNSGKFFEAGSREEVVLGYKLLENLKAQIGDTLVILAQGQDGVMGNLRFRISGTMKLGSPEFDAMAAFMDLRAAQELLAMEGRVNVLAISVVDLQAVEGAVQRLADALQRAKMDRLTVLPWEEVLPELKQAMEFDKIGDWIFLWTLIIIVTFGILNTVLMSVTERFREFGVSLAIGMQPKKLVALVFIETAFLALIGIVLGSIVGQLMNVYLETHPITFSGEFAKIYEEYGFLPQIVTASRITIVLTVASFMLLVSFFSCLYPAYKVSKLEPLKGIRYT